MKIITTLTTALFCGSGEASIPLFTQYPAWLTTQFSDLIARIADALDHRQFSNLQPALNVVYSGNPCDA